MFFYVNFINNSKQEPGAVFTTLYFLRNLQMGQISFSFFPGKSLQRSIMFENKAEQPSGAPLWGRLLGVHTNIRIGWKTGQEQTLQVIGLIRI